MGFSFPKHLGGKGGEGGEGCPVFCVFLKSGRQIRQCQRRGSNDGEIVLFFC